MRMWADYNNPLGRDLTLGNENFRKKFFDLAGWSISDLLRIQALPFEPETNMASRNVSFGKFEGFAPGDPEKAFWKTFGMPKFSHYDSFWNSKVGFLLCDWTKENCTLRAEGILQNGKIGFLILSPKNSVVSDSRFFNMLQEWLGEERFFKEPLPENPEGMVRALCFEDGTTLILEHLFRLRLYLLSAEASAPWFGRKTA